MNKSEIISELKKLDSAGICVLSKGDFEKVFTEEGDKAMQKSLQRMTKAGLLVRAAKGVYVNPFARCLDSRVIERIAAVMRRGEFNYVSLESALSEAGVISQIPNLLTVMTTGKKGVFHTPYGIIEFTTTSRAVSDLSRGTRNVTGRYLRVATTETARRDIARVGRNSAIVQDEDEDDEE